MDELHKILETMDVPRGRFNDLHWLSRNLGIRNAEHPRFQEALTIILQELRKL